MSTVSRSMIAKAMINNLENNISLKLDDFVKMNNYNKPRSISRVEWVKELKHRQFYLKTFVDRKAFVMEKTKEVIMLEDDSASDIDSSERIATISAHFIKPNMAQPNMARRFIAVSEPAITHSNKNNLRGAKAIRKL